VAGEDPGGFCGSRLMILAIEDIGWRTRPRLQTPSPPAQTVQFYRDAQRRSALGPHATVHLATAAQSNAVNDVPWVKRWVTFEKARPGPVPPPSAATGITLESTGANSGTRSAYKYAVHELHGWALLRNSYPP